MYTDDECASRVKKAVERQPFVQQSLPEAFKALGFNPEGLGSDNKKVVRKKTKGEQAEAGLSSAAPG